MYFYLPVNRKFNTDIISLIMIVLNSWVELEVKIIGLQPTKTRAELDSSTVLKQIFYEYHPLKVRTVTHGSYRSL